MLKLVYAAIFKSNFPEEGFTVTVPDLPGCTTFGHSMADAILMAQDAACGWILDELEDGKSIPEATDIQHINTKQNEFLTLLVLDMDPYIEKYGKKTVRKNTTIPAYLNTFGEKNHINYSKVLTDALMEMYLNQA